MASNLYKIILLYIKYYLLEIYSLYFISIVRDSIISDTTKMYLYIILSCFDFMFFKMYHMAINYFCTRIRLMFFIESFCSFTFFVLPVFFILSTPVVQLFANKKKVQKDILVVYN